MFVGSRMKKNVRLMLAQNSPCAFAVCDISHAKFDLSVCTMLEQRQALKKQSSFALIQADQLVRVIVKNLATKLGTDRASCSSDKHSSARDFPSYRLKVDLNRVATEQVFQTDF